MLCIISIRVYTTMLRAIPLPPAGPCLTIYVVGHGNGKGYRLGPCYASSLSVARAMISDNLSIDSSVAIALPLDVISTLSVSS